MFFCLYYSGRRDEEEKTADALLRLFFRDWTKLNYLKKMMVCMTVCAFVGPLLVHTQLGEY